MVRISSLSSIALDFKCKTAVCSLPGHSVRVLVSLSRAEIPSRRTGEQAGSDQCHGVQSYGAIRAPECVCMALRNVCSRNTSVRRHLLPYFYPCLSSTGSGGGHWIRYLPIGKRRNIGGIYIIGSER